MAMARHTGDFTAMVRAERTTVKKKKEEDSAYSTWRSPVEGVAP